MTAPCVKQQNYGSKTPIAGPAIDFGSTKVARKESFQISKEIYHLIGKIQDVIDRVMLSIRPTQERGEKAQKKLEVKLLQLTDQAADLRREIYDLGQEKILQGQSQKKLFDEINLLQLREHKLRKNNYELKKSINDAEEKIASQVKVRPGYEALVNANDIQTLTTSHDKDINKLNLNTAALAKNVKEQKKLKSLMQIGSKSPATMALEEKKKVSLKNELINTEHKLKEVKVELQKIEKSKMNLGVLGGEFAIAERKLRQEFKALKAKAQTYTIITAKDAVIDKKEAEKQFQEYLDFVKYIKSEITPLAKYVENLATAFQKSNQKDPVLAQKIVYAQNRIKDWNSSLIRATTEFKEIHLTNLLSSEFAGAEKKLGQEFKTLKGITQAYAKIPAKEAVVDKKESETQLNEFLEHIKFIKSELDAFTKHVKNLSTASQTINNPQSALAHKFVSAQNKIEWWSNSLAKAKIEFKEIQLKNLYDLKQEALRNWESLANSGLMKMPANPNAEIAQQLGVQTVDVANVDTNLARIQQALYSINQKVIRPSVEAKIKLLNTKIGEAILILGGDEEELLDKTRTSYKAWRDNPNDVDLLNKLSYQILKEENRNGEIKLMQIRQRYIQPLRALLSEEKSVLQRMELKQAGKQSFTVSNTPFEEPAKPFFEFTLKPQPKPQRLPRLHQQPKMSGKENVSPHPKVANYRSKLRPISAPIGSGEGRIRKRRKENKNTIKLGY